MFDTSEEKTKEIIDSILTWDVTPQVVPDAPKIAEPPVDMSKHDCVQLAITTIKEKRKEVYIYISIYINDSPLLLRQLPALPQGRCFTCALGAGSNADGAWPAVPEHFRLQFYRFESSVCGNLKLSNLAARMCAWAMSVGKPSGNLREPFGLGAFM